MESSGGYAIRRITMLVLVLAGSVVLWLNLRTVDLSVPRSGSIERGRGWPLIWRVDSHEFGLPGAMPIRKKSKKLEWLAADIGIALGLVLAAGFVTEKVARRRENVFSREGEQG